MFRNTVPQIMYQLFSPCWTSHPSWKGPNNSDALTLEMMQRHFPVSLLSASPTTIGHMSSGDPPSLLIKAVSEPPAIQFATPIGALPPAKMFTMALREEQMEIGRWTSAASIKYCIRIPEGPQALSLGN